MKKKTVYEKLQDEAELYKRQEVIMQKLQKKHPTWSRVTLFVLSGDLAHSEKVDALFQAGEISFDEAQNAMGSFARWDWLMKQYRAGTINPVKFHENMCHWWSASDPDDTDKMSLEMFKNARAASPVIPNRGQYLSDEHESLPLTEFLTVYHGQDLYEKKIGFAWTLDLAIAKKFAAGAWARAPRPGFVLKGVVERINILAYITGRGEQEVIVQPKLVKFKQKIWSIS